MYMIITWVLFVGFSLSIIYHYYNPEKRLEKNKKQTDIFGVLHPDEFL